MKKGIISLLGILVMAATVNVSAETIKASKNYTSKDITGLGAFSALLVSDNIDVQLRQSMAPQTAVQIYGADNVIDLVKVEIIDTDVLHISFIRPLRIKGEDELSVTVSGPKLMKVEAKNGAEIELMGMLKSDMLALHATGKSEIKAANVACTSLTIRAMEDADIDVKDLACQQVEAFASDKADIDLKGTAQNVKLENKGSGDIDAEGLKAQTVQAVVKGAGDISCMPIMKLDAKVEGRGKIEYKGMPAQINKMGNAKKIMADK